ncbi:MAG: nitroreductase [Candidatus Epulonipiscioides saccharophilum]|nr:MAG: nitroreductase [Epulopiscium sp. AS2M-Bin001]
MIKERRSVRKYKDEIVDKKTVEDIIEDCRFAPSWGNTQTARYNIITDPKIINELAEKCVSGFVYNMKTLKHAKNVAVISFVKGKSGAFEKDKAAALGFKDGYVTSKGSAWEVFDSGIATQTFCLSAYDHGVGTCILGVIEDENIKKVLSLPDEETVAVIVTFGYPDETPQAPPRKEVAELARFY